MSNDLHENGMLCKHTVQGFSELSALASRLSLDLQHVQTDGHSFGFYFATFNRHIWRRGQQGNISMFVLYRLYLMIRTR